MEGNKPEKKFSTGAVSAAIWKNQGVDKQGQSFESFSITLDRRYKDNKGEWKSTNSLRLNDLPKVGLVVMEAYKHLVLSANNAKPLEGVQPAVATPAAV